jgi:hypothetical protein
MRWIKLYLTCICILKKFKLTHHCFKSSLSICNNWIDRVSFFLFFGPTRFVSAQLVSSPPFPLPVSPLLRLTSLRCVVLPFHRVKMSLLSSLHLSAMLRPVASSLEPKLKHWICTTSASHPPRTVSHPPRTVRLPPSTTIKISSQSWSLSPPLNRISILPPP